MNTEELLSERQKTHGIFLAQSATAQSIKDSMRKTPNWSEMPKYMRESLEMIATKIARLGHGNCGNIDSAIDIAGYAELMVREMKK